MQLGRRCIPACNWTRAVCIPVYNWAGGELCIPACNWARGCVYTPQTHLPDTPLDTHIPSWTHRPLLGHTHTPGHTPSPCHTPGHPPRIPPTPVEMAVEAVRILLECILVIYSSSLRRRILLQRCHTSPIDLRRMSE